MTQGSSSLRRAVAVAALLVTAGPHALIACTSVPPQVAPDPREWSSIQCQGCEKAGVTVETRRSINDRGEAGRYLFARISNLNTHGVTFLLELESDGPYTGDPDFLRRQVRVTLSPTGDHSSSTLLTLDYSSVKTAHVSGLERM